MSEQNSEVPETSDVAPAKKKRTKVKERKSTAADGSKRPSVFQTKKKSTLGPSSGAEDTAPLLDMFRPARNSNAADVSFVSYSIGENSLDFGGRMDKLAELELQQLWQTLWNGVHDVELLQHAENNPRARWNPYRPTRGGPHMREQVLNSQLVEFKDVIPTDAIYLKGTRLSNGPTAFDPPTLTEAMESLRRPSERGSQLNLPVEYTYEVVPSDQLRSELYVQGASLPVHEAPRDAEEMSGAVEEILVAAGKPPVDVFALQRDSKKASKNTKSSEAGEQEQQPEEAGDSTTTTGTNYGNDEDITPETVHQEEMATLLFQHMWRKVVLPFYVKSEADRCSTPPADTSLAVESLSPSPQERKNVTPSHNLRIRSSSAFAAQTAEDAPVASLALTRGAQLVRRPTTSGPVRSSVTALDSGGGSRVPPAPPPPHTGGGAAHKPMTSSATEAAKLLEQLNREHAAGDQPRKGTRHKKKRHHSSKKLIEEEVIDADTEASSPGRKGTHLLQRRLSPYSRDSSSVALSTARSENAANVKVTTNHPRQSTHDYGRMSGSAGFTSEKEPASSPASGVRNAQRNLSSSSRRTSPTRDLTPKQLQLSRNASELCSASGTVASPRENEEPAPAVPQMVDSSYDTDVHLRHGSAPQKASTSLTEPPATNHRASANKLRSSDFSATLQKAVSVSSNWRAKNAEHMAHLYGVPAKTKRHTAASSASAKPSRFGSPTGADRVVMSGESEDGNANTSVKGREPSLYDSPDGRSRNSTNTNKPARDKPSQTMYFKSNKSSTTRRHVVPTTKRMGSPSPSLLRHRGLEPMAQPQETKQKSAASPINASLSEVGWKRRGSSPQGRRLEPLTLGEPGLH